MTGSNDSVGAVQSAVEVQVSIALRQSAGQTHDPYLIVGGGPLNLGGGGALANEIYGPECKLID